MKQSIAELRRMIKSVFKKSASVPKAIVEEVQDYEDIGLEEDFHGRQWQDVASSILDEHSTNLPLMAISAYAYYLPAFMLRALECIETGDLGNPSIGFLVDTMVFEGKSEPDVIVKRKYERIRALTMQKCRVAYEFLKYIRDHDHWLLKENIDASLPEWERAAGDGS